jgi:hypothetical protein
MDGLSVLHKRPFKNRFAGVANFDAGTAGSATGNGRASGRSDGDRDPQATGFVSGLRGLSC